MIRSFIIVISSLFAVQCSGQSTYFNELQSEDWSNSTGKNIELIDEGYLVSGSHVNEINQSETFIQEWSTGGDLLEVIANFNPLLQNNFAESINVIEDGIIFGWGTGGEGGTAHGRKLDFEGIEIWSVLYDCEDYYSCEFVLSKELGDGNILFAGHKTYLYDNGTNTNTYKDVFLSKVDENGNELWTSTIDFLENQKVRILSMHELANGEIIFTGVVLGAFNNDYGFILHLDSEGNHTHTHTWGNSAFPVGSPWSVLEEDSTILTVAYQVDRGEDEETFTDQYSIGFLKYNVITDSVVWQQENEETYFRFHLSDFIKTEEDEYVISGFKQSEYFFSGFLAKFDEDLEMEWLQEYEYDEGYDNNNLYDVEQTPDGGYVAVGQTSGLTSFELYPQQTWLLKVDACGDQEYLGCDTTTIGITEVTQNLKIELYPNPAQDQLTVTSSGRLTSYSIHNLLGKEVYRKQNPSLQTQIDVTDFSPGVYVMNFYSENEEFLTEKFIIE